MSNHSFQSQVFSFPPSENIQDYTLAPINANLKLKLIKFVSAVQQSKKHHLLYRGDSVPNELYGHFLSKNLGRFFIVGEKAKSNAEEGAHIFRHYGNTGGEMLVEEISELISICNSELDKHRLRRGVGLINGLIPNSNEEELKGKDFEKLQKFKLLLLSFLHNKGADNYYKDCSPFISLTANFNTAKRFANGGDNKIVFLYILNNGNRFYYTARKLRNELKSEFNISWYRDIHSEYLILGAMYPDKLIGFYEIGDDEPKSFILNPWFKKHLENNDYSSIDDVEVAQGSFNEYAQDLGLNSFVQRYDEEGTNQWIAKLIDHQNKALSYRF